MPPHTAEAFAYTVFNWREAQQKVTSHDPARCASSRCWLADIGVSTYRVTRQLPEPVREELPSVEDLQEVVHKLRSEMEMLRKELADEE